MLVCFANGMTVKVTARTLGLTQWQTQYDCRQIQALLGAKNMTEAVTIAWRRCLLDADEIGGGPSMDSEEAAYRMEVLLSYRERFRRHPPKESWPELRARAARIAREYRAGVQRPALGVEGEP